MGPDNFHRFPELPLELQDMIWEQCLPQRVISPQYKPEMQKRLGEMDDAKESIGLPQRALVPFRPPLISQVCRRARATVLRCGRYIPVSIEPGYYYRGVASVWLNKKSNWVYFNLLAMTTAIDESHIPRHIFELARDPSVPLLISTEIQPYLDNELGFDGWETVGSRLYKLFMGEREHLHLVVDELDLILSGDGYEHAVETGLFGLFGEDTAIVPFSNKAMLQDHISLYEMYDARESHEHRTEDSQVSLINNMKLRRGDLQAEQEENKSWYMLCDLLRWICKQHGEIDIPAGDMLRKDGSLDREHPVVKRLGITMPTHETVVLVHLRHLDTLFKSPNRRSRALSCDSDDSTCTD